MPWGSQRRICHGQCKAGPREADETAIKMPSVSVRYGFIYICDLWKGFSAVMQINMYQKCLNLIRFDGSLDFLNLDFDEVAMNSSASVQLVSSQVHAVSERTW